METFLLILRYAAGPVLGAVIGYFTNWLAVKMLFRPYYPKKIGKWRLPFTPGIIPKRQPALAKAVGRAVGEELFTKEDLSNALTSDAAKEKIADYAVELWRSAGDGTANQLAAKAVSQEQSEEMKNAAGQWISQKLYDAVRRVDLGAVVARESAKVVNQKKASLGMLAMFVSDDLVSSLTEKLAVGINGYVEEHGKEVISEAVDAELNRVLELPLCTLTQKVEDETVRRIARLLYAGAVRRAVEQLADSVDVAAIVEEKLNAMDVKSLEKLVLSVMKKELNAIVNLGAIIGFLLGIIMIFV